MNDQTERYPQTHIQTIGPLLLQMHRLGFSAADLDHVSGVYHFALKLWSVNVQASCRPFVCHLVGTASWAAEYGADLETINAALLHAAYGTGDFGVRIPGVTEKRRRMVREQIGARAEGMVHRFHVWFDAYGTHWDQVLDERPVSDFTEEERSVMFLRVCNDLDDISDKPYTSTGRRQRIDDYTHGALRLARAISREDMAEKLQALDEQWRDIQFLPESVAEQHPTGFITLPPAFRKKLWPGIREVWHRWRTTGSIRVD